MFAALNGDTAVDGQNRRKTYIAFAAVYSLPLLQRGLSFNAYVLACVAACALHVQVMCGSAASFQRLNSSAKK